jgi:hypothetical protein
MKVPALKFPFAIYIVFSLPIFSAISAHAGTPQRANFPTRNPAGNLDTVAIHGFYLDGDFDKAIAALESALNRKQLATHGDSVFVFKHLGVMDAAREETREKGKYYMLQLLNLEPSATILDMYASDMIYMTFKNIKDEYEGNRLRRQSARLPTSGSDKAAASDSESVSRAGTGLTSKETLLAKNANQKTKEPRNHHALYWIGGASSALIGVGVATYLYTRPPHVTRVTYDVR